jgi:hypothetical protein
MSFTWSLRVSEHGVDLDRCRHYQQIQIPSLAYRDLRDESKSPVRREEGRAMECLLAEAADPALGRLNRQAFGP